MDRLRLPQIWSYNVPLVLFFYLILFFVSMTFIYSCLFLAPLGLRHSAETASGCSEPELLAVAVGASHCSGFSPGAQALNARASGVVRRELSSPSASCGIFLDQGLNPCSLHWQADSHPLHHERGPPSRFFCVNLWLEKLARLHSTADGHCLDLLFY